MTIVEIDGDKYLIEVNLPKMVIECPTCLGRLAVFQRVHMLPDASLLVDPTKAVCCMSDAMLAIQEGGFNAYVMSCSCPKMTDEQLDNVFERLEQFLAWSYVLN